MRTPLAGVSVGVAAAGGLAVLLAQSCGVPGLPDTIPDFHLVGMHREIPCSGCHTTGTLSDSVARECIACHLDARPADHYPGDCGQCHQATGWDDIVVDHEPYLSLGGGHAPLVCTDCHTPDTFGGLDAACETCHEATRPTGHFTGPCATCHTVSDWDDGTFDHDPFFPTPHRGVSACTSCHPANNYQVFVCTDCHEHSQSRMDDKHDEVRSYVYNSTACLECHPRGREEDD